MRRGWWPEGTAAPITPQYDPDHPSWQKAIAYRMDSETTTVFRQAFQELSSGGARRFVTAKAFGGRTVPRATDLDG
ncbi:hypothetical protein [Streptomyces sp. NPDC012746]|uniref:hypothetical protein n=1 Tax=Streptomyces sp. NPDC012746 TaxID=3364845 RepID=UPI00368F77A7